ncbi:DUF3850 domain-containing protein [Lysinibacillus fusiformis]|nr:DUF3850 domain-containing protein [Lysinibacillus fusiformis]
MTDLLKGFIEKRAIFEKKKAEIEKSIEHAKQKGIKVNRHELKILPEFFEAVILGLKAFEIRKNDRDYKIGDIVFLNEFDGEKMTGRWTERVITYVTDYEQKEGYIAFSIVSPY